VKTGKAPKGSALVDLAREAVENFIHAEKRFLDGVAEEATRATKNKPTDRVEKKAKKTELAELGRRATESFIEAQKRLVDVAGRQMNANLKTASRTAEILKPLPVVPLSDWTRAGVQSFVDAQKALMDAVTKPRNGTKPAAGASRKPVRGAKRRRPSLEKPLSHPAA
jgi:3'-phosphoadenosine 5'-phosphosulfate sulfotransferase (PAPS reductase)/FAD synthetase